LLFRDSFTLIVQQRIIYHWH